MRISRYIKRNSRRALAENWSQGVAAGLILTLSTLLSLLTEQTLYRILNSQEYRAILERIPVIQGWLSSGHYGAVVHLLTILVVGVIEFFLLIPLLLGICKWAFAVVSAKPAPITYLFYYYTGFRKYRTCIHMGLSIFFRMFGYLLVGILPAACIYSLGMFYQNSSDYSSYIAAVIRGFSILFLVMGLIYTAYAMMKYVLAGYLYADDLSLRPSQAIHGSVRIMARERFHFLWLVASFLPLFLCCILVVPLLFVIPYFSVCSAMYAKYLIERDKRLVQPLLQEEKETPEDVGGSGKVCYNSRCSEQGDSPEKEM